MRDIAVPTDSSSSRQLLDWILEQKGLDPRRVEMAPDLGQMLEECDGALIIGDRALLESKSNPNLVIMDLGEEWTKQTSMPMVFGVFAARKDTDSIFVSKAHSDMVGQLEKFYNDPFWRSEVIKQTSKLTGLSETRLDNYYSSEVWNMLDPNAIEGLDLYLKLVCGVSEGATWAKLN